MFWLKAGSGWADGWPGAQRRLFPFFSLSSSMWKHLVPPELGETKKHRCFQVGSIINIRSNTRSIPFYYAKNAPFSYKKVLLICLRIQSAWSHPNKTDLLCAFSSLVTRTHVWLSLSYWKKYKQGNGQGKEMFWISKEKSHLVFELPWNKLIKYIEQTDFVTARILALKWYQWCRATYPPAGNCKFILIKPNVEIFVSTFLVKNTSFLVEKWNFVNYSFVSSHSKVVFDCIKSYFF